MHDSAETGSVPTVGIYPMNIELECPWRNVSMLCVSMMYASSLSPSKAGQYFVHEKTATASKTDERTLKEQVTLSENIYRSDNTS